MYVLYKRIPVWYPFFLQLKTIKMIQEQLSRYSIIEGKVPREIVLLIGSRCKWQKCTFCNYHLDYHQDENVCYKLNQSVLAQVTGVYHRLEIINSGSFVDLDEQTMELIKQTCLDKDIHTVHFEAHWMYRQKIAALKERFEKVGIKVIMKIGVETFDYDFRENILLKGLKERNPAVIRKYFDDICLLQGIDGQTYESMINDIETGLQYFDRVCINIMVENGMPIKPNAEVIEIFKTKILPKYINNDRVDCLLTNTDFGVGGPNYDK